MPITLWSSAVVGARLRANELSWESSFVDRRNLALVLLTRKRAHPQWFMLVRIFDEYRFAPPILRVGTIAERFAFSV